MLVGGNMLGQPNRPTQDPNRWGTTNTALEATWWLANLLDATTTVNGIRSGKLEESYPFLGKNPKPAAVWGTALGTGAMHTIGSSMLDEPYRTVYQILTNLLKGYAVHNNIQVGAKITF